MPTLHPLAAATTAPPTATPSTQPSASPTRTATPRPTETPTVTLTPQPSTTPIVIPALPPTATARPLAELPGAFVFGQSVQGRELSARRFGSGPQMLMLVGGIHGGWESNTVTLVEALIAHFEANPDQVLPGLSLLLVPALNPDGAALGGTLAGRFNANGVDLNRNWGCEWEATAYFRDDEVDPGSEPFSEPETTALAALINDFRPAAVLFYHSAANGIFGGRCGDESHSGAMVTVLGEATGYEYGADFTSYPVSGTAPTWVDSLGIPAADVELASASATEFERNLRGVLALQCWLVGEAAADLSLCSLNP